MTDVPESFDPAAASTALLLNLSGGKDSTRMLGLVREKYPTLKTYAVMADTGFEPVKTRAGGGVVSRYSSAFRPFTDRSPQP